MTKVHVVMMIRNEKDRQLSRSLPCAVDIAKATGGNVLITDDASDDGTSDDLRRWAASESEHVYLRRNQEPKFMQHEGRARQEHLEHAGEHIDEGDWVLSLDADETINSIDLLKSTVADAWARDMAILMPLYEFWSPTQYRVDGYWFGTLASRLFRWKDGGRIQDREFGCGSEPTYVADAVRAGNVHRQKELHLLHWGYVNQKDRVLKYERYTKRVGGHGHNNKHVRSIVDPNPTLKTYDGKIDW